MDLTEDFRIMGFLTVETELLDSSQFFLALERRRLNYDEWDEEVDERAYEYYQYCFMFHVGVGAEAIAAAFSSAKKSKINYLKKEN